MQGLLFAVFFALMALVSVQAQRQFALTDKVAQGNFAYDGPSIYEELRPYRVFAKRAQRFAYENDSPFSGKFAKMVPNNQQREFAFAFAKRAE